MVRNYVYKQSEIMLFLSGNWWSFSINGDPCLENFEYEYQAKKAAESIVDLELEAKE